jgi:hypothetical protein
MLTNTEILPNEGASYGRTTYWQACILDALDNFKNNKYKNALSRINMAREWPENLGVGKPYNTDERIEDYLESLYWQKKNNAVKANTLEGKVIAATIKANHPTSSDFLGAVLLKKEGRENEAKTLLGKRLNDNPNNLIAAWNVAKFSGNNTEADRLIHELKLKSGGSFFNPRFSDSGFALILNISKLNE